MIYEKKINMYVIHSIVAEPQPVEPKLFGRSGAVIRKVVFGSTAP